MIVALVILGLAVVAMAMLMYKRQTPQSDNQSALLIKQDLDRLSEDIVSLKDNINHQISERLDKSQALMVGSLQKQFSESAKLIGEVTRSLTELKESNKQVVNITDELKTLQNVLQNPKQRGVLGLSSTNGTSTESA